MPAAAVRARRETMWLCILKADFFGLVSLKKEAREKGQGVVKYIVWVFEGSGGTVGA